MSEIMAAGIGSTLIPLHFIAIRLFKSYFVKEFNKADLMEKLVHVLVNLVLVVPFSRCDIDIEKPPDSIEDEDEPCENKMALCDTLNVEIILTAVNQTVPGQDFSCIVLLSSTENRDHKLPQNSALTHIWKMDTSMVLLY